MWPTRSMYLRRELGRVAAAEEAVAGVEEEPGRRAGVGHEAVDLVRRSRRPCPCGGGRRASGPGRRRCSAIASTAAPNFAHAASPTSSGPSTSGRVVVAVDGVRGLADDADVAAHRLQQVEVRLDGALLVLDRTGEEVERVPAGDEAQAVGPSAALQRGRVGRHLVALLDAVEADLAGLAQALLERRCRRRASGRRRSTRRWGWCRRGSSVSPPAAGVHGPSRSPPAPPRTSARSETSGTATSHQAPPASVVGVGSVSMTMT